MKFEIKNWMSNEVIFSLETESFKLCVEAAIKSKADLRSADLRSANLRSANLRSANLSSADLRSADLRSADLRSANLRSADLRSADLRSANLRSADLISADLRSADLSSADLSSADLRSANLRSANLRSANLSSADLRSADGLKLIPICISGHRHYLQTTQEGKLSIGCETHSFKEWKKIADQLGSENEYSALDVKIYKKHIAHIEEVSKLLWKEEKQ